MDVKIYPNRLKGKIPFIPGKSHIHRIIIAEALAFCSEESEIAYSMTAANMPLSDDTKRTFEAVRLLKNRTPVVDCGASGTTLRMLLPVFGVLCNSSTFLTDNQLSDRPVSELTEQMASHGCNVHRRGNIFSLSGRLQGGDFFIPGDISSQYISGLLFALPLTDEGGNIILTTELSSERYVDLTMETLENFGITVHRDNNSSYGTFAVPGRQKYQRPEKILVHRDWSSTAFWLTAAFAGSDLTLDEQDICHDSSCTDNTGYPLPDMEIRDILKRMGSPDRIILDCDGIPDLVPVLAVAAALRPSDSVTELTGLKRLRYKESDRIKTSAQMLKSLGGSVSFTDSSMCIVSVGGLKGGMTDGSEDHRIVMAAATAATACIDPVIISGADAVNKSYPRFFKDFKALGGRVEIL